MRFAYGLLCLMTAFCVIWTILACSYFAIGPVDGLYGQFRLRIIDQMGESDRSKLVVDLGRFVAQSIQSIALMTALPLLITLFSWAWIATRALGQRQELVAATETPKSEIPPE